MNEPTTPREPPHDYSGARYDWVDPDDQGVNSLAKHSFNCKCPDCLATEED
jgi:hypothetical protein